MAHVPIRDELFEPLQKYAEREQTSLEELVNVWLTRQLALAREEKIHEESARFQARHAELLQQYPGEYIAMLNGEVLDHDPDAHTLYLRVREHWSDIPVLIALVTYEPLPAYQMRSPRFQR
jgi:hypothetical protein